MGKLTAMKVKSISKAGRYSDGNGLMLVCKASGAKSWIARIQFNGKRRDIGLGSTETISLSTARERVIEARKDIREGNEPLSAYRPSQGILEPPVTFREEAETFFEERKANWKNVKHRAQWISSLQTYAFPAIGDLPINDISSGHVRDLLAPIWNEKAETASRVLQRIVSVLDYSHSRGNRDAEAPDRSIRAGLGKQKRTVNHFAALPRDQLPALVSDLRSSDTVGRLALLFLLLTAARSGEVRGAMWSEIDLEKRLWTIPASRMKASRLHVVPLSDQAVTVLEKASRLRKRTTDDLIFPGASQAAQSDSTLKKVLRQAVEGNWTVHGLRSTFRDWAAEKTNHPPAAVEAALAHSIQNKTEAAYHRTTYLDLRRTIMQEWANLLHGI